MSLAHSSCLVDSTLDRKEAPVRGERGGGGRGTVGVKVRGKGRGHSDIAS